MDWIKILFKETLRGKTLGRSLQNIAFSEIHLSGKGLDLGAKSDSGSYYRFLRIDENTEITLADLQPETEDVLKVDLEDRIPVPDESQDFLILNNVLEHVYDYRTCISETFRVLKKSGKLIGTVPFLHQIHHDPDDHFRYTQSTLKRIFKEVGYNKIQIKSAGYGPCTTAVTFIAPLLRLKPVVFIAYLLSMAMDGFLNRVLPENFRVKAENFPLHYFFICEKEAI